MRKNIHLKCYTRYCWQDNMLIGFSGFPFLVISMALSALLLLSAVIIGLAWAYQNDC